MTIQYQGVWSLQSAAQLQSTQRWVTDPLYKNTTLLLQADDAANAAQNNTFLDSSSNSFAITRNGNTTQGTFTPFSPVWSNYFNGSTSYITLPASSNWLFNGDACLEAWVYRAANTDGIIFATGGASSADQFGIFVTEGLWWGVTAQSGLPLPNINEWAHCVVTRSGSTIRRFINGVLVSTATNASAIGTSGGTAYIGARSGSSVFFNGYISNLRVINGSIPTTYQTSSTTLGTVVFTPPTTAATTTSQGATSGDVKLITCQSNRFVDTSSTPSSLTPVGSPSVQAFSPFAPQYQWTPSVIGGSGYFDGNADSLALPTTINSQIGALAGKQRTYEFWINTAGIQAITAYIMSVFGNFTASAVNGRYAIALVGTSTTSSQTVQFGYTTSTSTTANVTTTNSLIQKSWNHVAITVDATTASSTTIVIYLNGVGQTFTGQNLSTHTTDPGTNFWVGDDRSGNQVYWGNIGGFKISSGIQRSSNFTPPTSPFTSDANTILLLNFTNAGIYDGTMKNNLETVGNAQISTAVVKYGSGSMAFDGTGDYLNIPTTNQSLTLGSANWTIEFWIYLPSLPSTRKEILYLNGNSSGFAAMSVHICSNNKLGLSFSESGSGWKTDDTTGVGNALTATTWQHVAVTRNGQNIQVYLDGVSQGATYTTTAATTSLMTTYTLNQVCAYNSASFQLNAYLDDLRVTVGVARYTANFIPPSVALPRQ